MIVNVVMKNGKKIELEKRPRTNPDKFIAECIKFVKVGNQFYSHLEDENGNVLHQN